MTTATVAASSPEQRVVASIRALKASRRIGTEDLYRRVGLSRSTWFDKMRTGNFTIGEVVALAELFGVSVQSLVDGQVTVASLTVILAAATDNPARTAPRRGHLRPLPTL
jgi:hypothetical protein